MATPSPKQDIYTRVTARILAALEQGVRPWIKPWSVDHAAGRITRPLRHNGIPYRGVNVLLLWGEALEKGYAAPLWMTYKQAQEFGAQVRKGERLFLKNGSVNSCIMRFRLSLISGKSS